MDMAPNIIPEPGQQKVTLHPPRNLHNPLPLSASQEAQVRDMYYKRVRSKCATEIKEFADCARGRTVTAAWKCRSQRFAMNSCMIAHATPEEQDAAREEWFAEIEERRRKREEDAMAVEKRRLEVIEMIKQQEEKEKREMEAKKAQQEQGQKRWWWST